MTLHDLSSLSLLGFLAPIALFYNQTKGFVLKIFRMFWKERSLTEEFAIPFYLELRKQSKIFNFDDYQFSRLNVFSLKRKQDFPVLFKVYHFELAFYKGFIPLFIFGGTNDSSIKIQYLKFTFNFEKLLNQTLVAFYQEFETRIKLERKTRFFIEYKQSKSLKELKGSLQGSPTSSPQPASLTSIIGPYYVINHKIHNRTMYFPVEELSYYSPQNSKNKYQMTETGAAILRQVEKWQTAEQWYKERNIPWRRGYLLNGKPGNGKSALVLEVAKQAGLPIYIFDLSSMDNHEFIEALNDMVSDSAIVLFEDIDAIFNGRDNLTKSTQFGGLTFDCFINQLSGINGIKNKLIFITTNHLDKVDPAVLRPGRIDEITEVQPLAEKEKRALAAIILDDRKDLINQVLSESVQDSTAVFENRCTKLALATFWNQSKRNI